MNKNIIIGAVVIVATMLMSYQIYCIRQRNLQEFSNEIHSTFHDCNCCH